MNDIDNKKYQVLVVDDEPLIRESLYEILRIEGYRVQMAASGEDALNLIERNHIDVVVTDMKLPKMNGIELLEGSRKTESTAEFILITGYGSIETAVEAMKKGAYDYITKPINDHEIKAIIRKIVEKKALIQENEELRRIVAKETRTSYHDMIGGSEKMQKVYHIVDSVASTNATILISGESGTGKSMVARAIHQADENRRDKPFVEISCGALSETLLESELFGHVKGAFTGAIKDKEGRFEFAKGGTIFLDEIDAFSLSLQVKLLRVLQDGTFECVGDNVQKKADARIIVATNRNLAELVKEGEFREDLYYRVNVIAIGMPPLRDRKCDIDYLVKHFIKQYNDVNGKEVKKLSDEVRSLFLEYSWPGNIRELENAIEGSVIMACSDVIDEENLPNIEKFKNDSGSFSGSDEKNLKKAVEQPEKEHILSVLEECGWNRNKAASTLGVNRTTLYNKMKKYDIQGK